MLMVVSGFMIYYMYFNISEHFTTTEPTTTQNIPTTTQNIPSTTQNIPLTTQNIPLETLPTETESGSETATPTAFSCKPEITVSNHKSIMSRYFGVGFNIEYIEEINAYFIKHIPTIASGTLGGCYAVSNDNLTIRVRNTGDNTQFWKLVEKTDNISKYYIILPLNKDDFALQYENGNLALRPYTITTNFENQKWLIKDKKITRGIPVLNYSPGSLFTTEFDPYSTPSTYSNTISDQNTQQVTEVINNIKSGIHQYLGQLDNKYQAEDQVSEINLGQKDAPLNINLNLSSNKNQVSEFGDVPISNVTTEDISNGMLEIMDRYGASTNQGSQYTELYKKTDLENELNKYQGCKLLNINDYTSKRVGSCNCKL